ncbi:hypothetical protein ILUMI_06350 [Ignelater luminosus]|uniref:Uncharacterized protein n=1 Tax=Ignelater luminosus TaxID=2038154 RepID=A0A8K0D5G3_IGNLU|nr:hypothetical protein ILUMI_06350 [Ignelater luminosus]
MGKSSLEFITAFHFLEGQTLKEKRKSLMKLLNETKQSLQGKEEKIDFSLLQTKSPLEEIFKIDAVIYFKDIPEIIKILKSENIVFIKRILKVSSLFLNEIFENISGEELIEELFPHFSFNTKLKILNRLNLKNTKKGEEFFEVIQRNYGLYMASKIITSCSGEFIVKALKHNKIEVTASQLLKVIIKYPEFTEEIFEALNENLVDEKLFVEKYKIVFVFLMKNNLELFLKLEKKYNKGEFSLGHRATKSCLEKQNKNIVIQNSKVIQKYIKREDIHKSLNQEDFEKFYINLFPTSSKDLKDNFDNLLTVVGHSKNVNVLFRMYKNVYGCYLGNEFITIKLLEIMSPDERETLMENYAKPKEMYEDQWISFMKTEKSLPMLKDKISLTSNIKVRAKIVPYLVLTCKLNKDLIGLEDACKYMVTKHHNDHWRVRQGFMKAIWSNYNLVVLKEDHWKYLNQLLEIGLANNEAYYGNEAFLKGYITFRLQNSLSIEEQLKTFIKKGYYDLKLVDPKLQKQCLLLKYDLLHLGYEDCEINYGYITYLKELCQWNDKHPEDQFVVHTYTKAIDHIKSSIKKNYYAWEVSKVIIQCIKLNINEKDKNELLNLIFSCKDLYMPDWTFKWLVNNEPTFFLDHIETVTKTLIKSPCATKSKWLSFKSYSYLGIPQKICEILRQFVETKLGDTEIKGNQLGNAVKALAYLLNASDFLNLIKAYYPTISTVDVESQDGKWNYQLHKSIAVAVRHVIPASLATEAVLEFCKGDYLNLIQKSLYLISYNMAENKVEHLLNELSTRSVSVRKHSLHLGSKILNQKDTFGIYKKFQDDRNSSIRKYLLKGTFNFFCNHPQEQSWKLFKDNISNIDINDVEALDVLTRWKRLPKSYYQEYIIITWNIFESISDNSKVAQERKGHILDLILAKNVIQTLPKEFIVTMIKKYFLQSQAELYLKFNLVAAKFIIHCNSQMELRERLDSVFGILSGFIQQPPSVSIHKIIFDFIKEFCANFFEKIKIQLATEILSECIALFNNSFEICQFLSEYLHLQFTSICVTSSTLPDIALNISKLYSSLVEKVGMLIVESFHEIFTSFIPHFLFNAEEDVTEKNRYILIEEVMKSNGAVNAMVLAVFLLPDERPTLIEFRLKYDSIIKRLLKEQDPAVRVYLYKYLKSLNDIQE